MTLIPLQNGKVVLRDGKVGTGQQCCCGGGACCLPNGTCSQEYGSQQACEECTVVTRCQEYLAVEAGQPCPEGWVFSPEDEKCFRETYPASCSECIGYAEPTETMTGLCDQWLTGPCGTWAPGSTCAQAGCPECDDSCLTQTNPCVVVLNETVEDDNYLKGSSIGGAPFVEVVYKPGYLDRLQPCPLVHVADYVTQKNATAYSQSCDGVSTIYYRTWIRIRLFVVDCSTLTVRDVTSDAIESAEAVVCTVSGSVNCGFLCVGENPGFLNSVPQLVCP